MKKPYYDRFESAREIERFKFRNLHPKILRARPATGTQGGSDRSTRPSDTRAGSAVGQTLSEDLDRFFEAVPKDTRYHIELRTDTYLTYPVFAVLEKHGVGQVLSHWTWLPPLRKQLTKANQRIFNSGRQRIIRLMTLSE
jgi:hypothetical protein